MVEVLGLDTQIFSGAFSGFAGTVTMVVMYLLVAIVLWGCFYLLSFKHKVRIYKQTTSGVPIVIDTKARVFKRKEDGTVMWRFLKYLKDSHAAPSVHDTSITEKGKMSAECLMSMQGGVTWIKRDVNGTKSVELSAEERAAMANAIRRADEYKKKKLSEILMQWQGAIVLIMILVIFMLFFNKTVEPSIALGNSLKGTSEQMTIAMDRLSDAYARAYPELHLNSSSLVTSSQIGQVVNNNVPN